MSLALTLIALAAAWLAINLAIRRGLTAPRITGDLTPQGADWQAVRIPGVRAKQLFGWYIPATESPAPSLAILHGWGGNAEAMLPLAAPLHAAGFNLLIFEARNHGRSDSDDFSSLPRFAEDLDQALLWLAAQPGVDIERMGVIGHSVGAGAALLAASRSKRIAAVVSIAAFAHPATMMRRWLGSKGIPYRPLGAYILAYVQHVIGYRFDDIAPRNTIRKVNCPVLLIHGNNDTTVPPSEASEILSECPGANAELSMFAGTHEHFENPDKVLEKMLNFLHQHLDARNKPS